MRQLTGHDASFLYSDTAHSNANVTFVQIYDQSTAPGGKVRFKSILAHIESRLHRSSVFRNRLQRVPLELDYPYWVEDEHFDLEYHVRHIALPAPGDWRQFCIQASRIHARALDLSRPLWEIYVIEGLDSITDLPPGSFALLTKIHHAAIDVESHHEIIEVLHDTRRRAPPPVPPEPWFPEAGPSSFALLCRSAINSMLSPRRLAGPLARVAPAVTAFARDLLWPEHQANATRFNSVVSGHRVFDTRRFTVDEFDAIRRLVPGATLDDAVLAVCAGGLRRYLAAHAELPEADLAAITTIDVGPKRREATNGAVEWLHVQLGTAVADPRQRLALIQQQTSATESNERAAAASQRSASSEQGSAAALAVTRKLFGRSSVATDPELPLASCTVTPVPGPPVPMYLVGARMSYFSAILPIADGMGLVFAVTRYDGRVVISPTSCRELMPDPEAFTQCVRDSFQEYLALARGAAPVATSARLRRSAAGKRSPAGPKARTASTAPRPARAGRPRSTTPTR